MATEFQKQIWDKLSEIPRGCVVTYAELARAVGRPRASRAVGSACGANPNLIRVPCHRVVASSGQVGYYASGKEAKIALLQKEGITIEKDRVQDFDTVRFTWKK